MKKYLILTSVIILNCSIISAQNLPDEWFGEWSDYMYWYQGTELVDSVQTFMLIEKTENPKVLTWETMYFSKDTIVKDYQLKHLSENNFVLDEGNGIMLNSFLIDNQMISCFKVKDMIYPNIYEINGDVLTFEISYWTEGEMTTEDIGNFDIKGYQRSVLYRK